MIALPDIGIHITKLILYTHCFWNLLMTAMDLKNFYKHINMCLNKVNILQEDLLPSYKSIKVYSDFEEYLVLDNDRPSWYWNAHNYTYLVYSLFLEFTNDTCVKYLLAPQSHKVFNTNYH